MKKIIMLFILASSIPVFAVLENSVDNPYIMSIAGNGAVLASGALGLKANPASSIFADKFELLFTSRSLNETFENSAVSELNFSTVFPLDKAAKYGVLGLSLAYSGFTTIQYSELIFMANYSYRFDKKIAVGANIKYNSWSSAPIDQIYYNNQIEQWKNGFLSIDAGIIINLSGNTYTGLGLNNINMPSAGKSVTTVKVLPDFHAAIGRKFEKFNWETGFTGVDQIVSWTTAVDFQLIKNLLFISSGFAIKTGDYDSVFGGVAVDAFSMGARVNLNLKFTKLLFMYSFKYLPNAEYGNTTESAFCLGLM